MNERFINTMMRGLTAMLSEREYQGHHLVSALIKSGFLPTKFVEHWQSVNIEALRAYWLKNPTLRFTKVLVDMNAIDNLPGDWYYRDIRDHLIENNWLTVRESVFLTKDDGVYESLEEVDLERLKNIACYTSLSEDYIITILDEWKRRLQIRKQDKDARKRLSNIPYKAR